VPSFSHSIEVSQPPEEVFPWLLEEDNVPQWTGHLERYEQQGPLAGGSHVSQILTVAGGLTLDLEITRYDPPHGAETRFQTHGINVTSAYALEPNGGGGTRLTQSLDAQAGSFTARLLIPVLRGHLEKKLTEDLERLRVVLGG
jgi:uncharacterized protein YndB with AHSA1/START domain